ncbi:MAG: hypothetical protein ACRDDZ_04015 [Marinifilaceae bacterium]
MKSQIRFLVGVFLLSILTFNVCAQKHVHKSKTYDAIFRPDSLLSHEQQALKTRLFYVLRLHIEMQGDTLVPSFTKRNFVRSRIPLYYYSKAVEDVKSLNKSLISGKQPLEDGQKWIQAMVKAIKEENNSRDNVILLKDKR